MSGSERLTERVAELRRAFDTSFAEPIETGGEELASALAIRAGDRLLAARIEELSGVEACRRLVPLPGGAPELLGLTGVRGQLVAVYDLAGLLNDAGARAPASGAAEVTFRWLLLCAGSPEIGLAIEQIDGYLRFSSAELHDEAGAGGHARGALLRGGVLHGGVLRGLIHIPALVEAVLHRARGALRPSNGDL
jgi:chemotaxis signal transduction protein